MWLLSIKLRLGTRLRSKNKFWGNKRDVLQWKSDLRIVRKKKTTHSLSMYEKIRIPNSKSHTHTYWINWRSLYIKTLHSFFWISIIPIFISCCRKHIFTTESLIGQKYYDALTVLQWNLQSCHDGILFGRIWYNCYTYTTQPAEATYISEKEITPINIHSTI